MTSPTFEHVHARLGAVTHGVHEDGGEELVEDDVNSRSDEFVCEHLGEQLGCARARRRVRTVAVQVEQIDESTLHRIC